MSVSENSDSTAVVDGGHIVITPGVCFGKPRIAGTRLKVQFIAVMHDHGRSIDEIAEAYPHLKLAEIYAALAYYFDHQDEMQAQIKADREFVEELFRTRGPSILEEKLRELRRRDA